MNGTRTPMTALWEAPQRSGQQPVIQRAEREIEVSSPFVMEGL
jgi:hypothetical protein